jgi:Ser/Thr protein kinase RdoA (MazF antagonist)
VEHLTRRYGNLVEHAAAAGYLSAPEINVLQAAQELIPAFDGERPVPCHRDYCAANWLYQPDGSWAGIIDFEFAAWDVRAADFTRDPQWCWVRRPDLMEAFYEGYGRTFTAREEQQILFGHAEYALGAVVWGRENDFYGFEREGREALAYLGRTMTI